ncbi:MAG: hypothetical protein Q8L48_14670 [Archangium sp.]|nr:hypothetical protein [Archangium sp.]
MVDNNSLARPNLCVPKRPFERRDGVLLDSYEFPAGQKCTAQLSAHRLGEPLSEEQLQLARESSAQGRDRAQGAFVLRWEEKSEQTLEALLEGLRAGNMATPSSLLRYLDDARVRPALLEATRCADPTLLANCAQALGIAGGPGARDVLRQRMEELLAAPQTFEDSSFMNFSAGSAATVAQSLLGLDPDDTAAAKCLRMLLTHPCAHNRLTAAMCAAGAYRHGMKTEAMQVLESTLRPLVHNPDNDLFFAAIEALKVLEPQPVIERCVRLLDAEVVQLIPRAASFLTGLRLSENAVVPALIAWISRQPVARNALSVAMALGSLVPEELRLDLVKRALADESPSLRWAAISCLNSLERGQMIGLASTALEDETDPALMRALNAAANPS